MQCAQQHIAVGHFKLLFPERDLYQLVIWTKQRPRIGHALILKEKAATGPRSRFSHRTSAVKDSVYPLEPFPTLAQIKIRALYRSKHGYG